MSYSFTKQTISSIWSKVTTKQYTNNWIAVLSQIFVSGFKLWLILWILIIKHLSSMLK